MNKTTLGLTVCILTAAAPLFAQGNLTPPGPPAASMKTLAQVEPRTPISSLPYLISNSGSYYLTTNLVGTTSQSGITISNNNVTLDLNGFALIGIPNSFSGVSVTGSRTNISVINGSIYGWGSAGVAAPNARFSQMKDLRVSNNGFHGLRVGDGSIVSGCTTSTNENAGIDAAESCTITGCTSIRNGTDGIAAQSGATISNCTASENGDDGIFVAARGTITDCSANENQDNGFETANECHIKNNTFSRNVIAGMRITGYGNRIDSNHVNGSPVGFDIAFAGNLIIRNSTSSCPTDYDLTGTQTIGPIITASGTITSSNPWANFSF